MQLAEGFGWGFYTKVFTFYKNLATRIQVSTTLSSWSTTDSPHVPV